MLLVRVMARLFTSIELSLFKPLNLQLYKSYMSQVTRHFTVNNISGSLDTSGRCIIDCMSKYSTPGGAHSCNRRQRSLKVLFSGDI